MPRKPEEYAERTKCFVAQAARYGNLFAAAVSEILFGGSTFQSANVLNAESHAGGPLTAHPRSMTGGFSRWSLSAAGATRLGLPPEVANSAAVGADIATLFACVFSASPRHHRVTWRENRRIFGDDTPPASIAHLLSNSEPPCMLRVYLVTRDVRYTLKRLADIRDTVCKNKTLAAWVRDRDYGLACLVPTSQMLVPFRSAIERSPVSRSIRVEVMLGPTPDTLATELRKRRRQHV